MKECKILYAEDDETLSFLTKEALESKSFCVRHCLDGHTAFEAFCSENFDICILDIMLPSLDGFTLAKKIRTLNSNVPILFLSAKSRHEDKIQGFKTGADDYITKPFSIEELVFKIEVFLKRSKISTEAQPLKNIKIGNFQFEYYNQQITIDGKKIQLTHREAELLKYFSDHRNQLIKREILMQQIWGNDDYLTGRSLDVFISRLRKIFINDNEIKIENIHGVGFRLSLPA